jgi:hypothetical protein
MLLRETDVLESKDVEFFVGLFAHESQYLFGIFADSAADRWGLLLD